MLFFKRSWVWRFLRLTHDLYFLAIDLQNVEDELGAGGPTIHYPPCNPDLDIRSLLARLDLFIFLDELGEVAVDVEFVRVRVGVMALAELLDIPAADLEVLL